MSRSAAEGYARPSRWLHWLVAAVVLAQIPIGLVMVRIPEDATIPALLQPVVDQLYEWHKSFGIIIFVLALLRVGSRLVYGAPPPDAGLSPAQRMIAAATHHLLYVLLFLMPVLGYVGTAMCCAPVKLFSTVTVPIAISGSKDTAEAFLEAHEVAGFLMAVLVAMHIGAALYHYFIRKDGVMARISLFH